MKDYVTNMIKPGVWEGNIEIVAFTELFELNVNIYDLETYLNPWYSLNYPGAWENISLMYRNNAHYNIFTKKSFNSGNICIKNICNYDLGERDYWLIVKKSKMKDS